MVRQNEVYLSLWTNEEVEVCDLKEKCGKSQRDEKN